MGCVLWTSPTNLLPVSLMRDTGAFMLCRKSFKSFLILPVAVSLLNLSSSERMSIWTPFFTVQLLSTQNSVAQCWTISGPFVLSGISCHRGLLLCGRLIAGDRERVLTWRTPNTDTRVTPLWVFFVCLFFKYNIHSKLNCVKPMQSKSPLVVT